MAKNMLRLLPLHMPKNPSYKIDTLLTPSSPIG